MRRLLAVVPAVVLVGCSPAAVQGAGHAAPVRNEAATTRVATSPSTTEPVAPSVAPSVARAVATKRAVHAQGVPPKPAAPAANGCNSNYTPCVPDDPVDVDCEGGSGNGPSYVTGPVWVVGEDVYGLDADHNGVGCETGAAKSQVAAPPEAEAPSTTQAAPPTTTAPPPKPTKPPKTLNGTQSSFELGPSASAQG